MEQQASLPFLGDDIFVLIAAELDVRMLGRLACTAPRFWRASVADPRHQGGGAPELWSVAEEGARRRLLRAQSEPAPGRAGGSWLRALRDALDAQLLDAVNNRDVAAIERLAAEGASPDAKLSNGNPAVVEAAEHGHAGAVSSLVRLGADLDATDSFGVTALMTAAYYGHVECARALLVGGADRTVRATGGHRKGKTALEMAEEEGIAEVAALLRE